MPRIAILGGGQLARMTTVAARTAGVEVVIYDPDPRCCASEFATQSVTGSWDDLELVRHVASLVDVVTIDREDIPIPTLATASVASDVCPSPEVMATIRNKFWQKRWLRSHGFPVPNFHECLGTLDKTTFRYPGFLKAQTGTFDGRGVVEVSSAAELEQFASKTSWYFEEKIQFDREISVLVARSFSGDMVVYPPAVNHHVSHILDSAVIGADLDPRIVAESQILAKEIASTLRTVGLLVVEMFLTADGRLLVNELAPRPHNSYHGTERAFSVSQFEQLVRIVSRQTLDAPQLLQPTAIVNLLGDLWAGGEPAWERSLVVPGTRLHLYGKGEPRPGRKMGHLSAIAPTAAEALARAEHARLRAINSSMSLNPTEGAYEHTNRCVTVA